MGPLLVLIYINDLALVSSKLFSLLFADDSNMFLTGKDPNELIRHMNIEIKHVIDWLKVNKLSLNLKKTHFIIFQRRRAKFTVSEDLIIDGVKIDIKDDTKFLGVMIDKHLSFQQHVQYIKGKVARGIGILYKCKRVFGQETLKTLYNCFLYPYLNYCISVWGSTYQTYLDPLSKLQKRAIRLIAGVRRLTHSDPLFKQLRILKLDEIYIYSTQMFMLKYHNNAIPNIFESYFEKNSYHHSHETRSQNLYRPPLMYYDVSKRTVRATGVRIYNYFARSELSGCCFSSYNSALKGYLIDNNISLNSM